MYIWTGQIEQILYTCLSKFYYCKLFIGETYLIIFFYSFSFASVFKMSFIVKQAAKMEYQSLMYWMFVCLMTFQVFMRDNIKQNGDCM